MKIKVFKQRNLGLSEAIRAKNLAQLKSYSVFMHRYLHGMEVKKIASIAANVFFLFNLVGCGGGSDSPNQVANNAIAQGVTTQIRAFKGCLLVVQLVSCARSECCQCL
jgi:hypothetical protein